MNDRNPDTQNTPTTGANGENAGAESSGVQQLKSRIVQVMKTVYDPEIPVDIYELGMVYEVHADEEGHAKVVMTLTSPNCPVADSLPAEVQDKLVSVPGVESGEVELVWDPPWTPDKMSEAAKLELGMM